MQWPLVLAADPLQDLLLALEVINGQARRLLYPGQRACNLGPLIEQADQLGVQ